MKYYQTSKFPSKVIKSGATLLAVFCLLLVGAAAWFASSRIDNNADTDTSSSKNSSEYTQESNTYNSSETPAETPSETAEIESQTETAQDVNETVSDQPYEEEKPTFILPTDGNIAKGYSDTALQYSATFGDLRLHTGIDILCDEGSEILSAGSGTVISVEEDINLGLTAVIEHTKSITARYSCLANVYVKAGDKVSAGDALGTSTTVPCEESDLPHIHIEVLKDGNLASPLEVFGLQ